MTTFVGPQAGIKVQPRTGENGLIEITGEFDMAAAVDATHGGGSAGALGLNDVLQMLKVPMGARIKNVILSVPDMDTSTGVVLSVGIGGDTDKFIAAVTTGQAGGVAVMNNQDGHDYVMTAEDTIDILVATAATGTAATTGTLRLSVFYAMQGLPTSSA